MHGTLSIHFSELFADTVNAHGIDWARAHYVKHGMTEWEFGFWAHACGFRATGYLPT